MIESVKGRERIRPVKKVAVCQLLDHGLEQPLVAKSAPVSIRQFVHLITPRVLCALLLDLLMVGFG